MTNDIIEVIQERLKMLHERELLCADECRVLRLLVDEIEQQYIKLPLDADGIPIRPGEVLICSSGNDDVRRKVAGVNNSKIYIGTMVGLNPTSYRHANPDTVESLLEEFAIRYEQVNNAPQPKVGFGNEIVGEEELADVITEYAEKIKAAKE